MKKIFKTLVAILLFLLIYQLIVTFFINKRDYNYSVKTDNNEFIVKEKYERKKHVNMYSFLITDRENNNFVYSYKGDLNRQSKVVKDIISYNNNGLYCIAPVLKNDSIESIVCKYDKKLVTYNYLKQIGNKEVDNFINNLTSSKYKVNLEYKNINDAKTVYQNISYYNDIDANLYFTIWNYKSVYLINNNNVVEEFLLDNDLYENKYSIVCGEHFIIANPDDKYDSFYVVNIKETGQDKIESEEDISSNIYYNGVYKGKVYLTDITNKKQYVINPNKETIECLEKPKYYNGKKLVDIDISELIVEKKYFINDLIPDELIKKYGNNILYTEGNYYYKDKGNVYKIVGDNYDYKILLFSFDNLQELKALNGNLYFINHDTVYMYNDKIGIKRLIEDRELIYNYKNIFDVYEK